MWPAATGRDGQCSGSMSAVEVPAYIRCVGQSRQIRAARRRKRRMARVEHDLTPTQWAALQQAWNGCAYCGTVESRLERDCVLPISRGGRYTLTNVVPACNSCNTSKCNHEVTSWLRRKRLDERDFLERHLTITSALVASSSPASPTPGDSESGP